MSNARRSCLTSIGILTLLIGVGFAQQKSQDLDAVMKPLMGDWYGKVFRGKSILPLPEGGAPIRLKFEKTPEGQFQGIIEANTQGGKITDLSWQEKTKTLTGKTQFLNIALKIELKPEGKTLKGKITGLGINMPIEVGRQAPTVRRITLKNMTAEKWRKDAEFLRAHLPKVHKEWFHKWTEKDWNAAFKKLNEEIPKLSHIEIAVRLGELVAQGGDSHTGLGILDAVEFAPAPIKLGAFDDGVFLQAVPNDRSDLFGAKVLKIGKLPVDKALERVSGVVAFENKGWKDRLAAQRLSFPALLKALDIQESADKLQLTVESEGKSIGVEIPVAKTQVTTTGWVRSITKADPPQWLRSTRAIYRATLIPAGKDKPPVFYVAYNKCRQDARLPFDVFTKKVIEKFEEGPYKKFVIDLRHNTGGSSLVINPLMNWLAGKTKAKELKLYVLTSSTTFSSGMMNAHQLRDQASAVLVGQPTGGKPNHYGEVMFTQLPESRMRLSYSTKHFNNVPGNHDSIAPQKLIPLTAKDYFSGRDAVMEWVLTDE